MRKVQCARCGADHGTYACPETRVIRNCNNCVFLHKCDEGYSNWTVTDTTAICLAGQNPKGCVELPYGVNEKPEEWGWGQHALQCEWYVNGEGPHTDVDGEEEEAHARVASITLAVKEGHAAALAVVLGLYQPKEKRDE